jgi:hypothetical protein
MLMRFFLNLLFICMVSAAFAQQDTLPRHELYFGVNLTRLIFEDYELQVLYRVNNRSIVGVHGGYDFNRGEELFTDTKAADDTTGWQVHSSQGSEGDTRETSRYFFGKGPVFRMSYDYFFLNKKHRQKILITELLLKIRNYDNYFYQEYGGVFLESGSQKIFGLTVLFARHAEIENFLLLKVSAGLGFRYLQSNVVRPGHFRYFTEWIPEDRFDYHLAFPTVHFGISLIINTAGTGAPQVVW